MTRMNLPLPQDHLLMIGKLPQGFGISVKENGIGLKVESDGKGGLSIAAETEDLQKKSNNKEIVGKAKLQCGARRKEAGGETVILATDKDKNRRRYDSGYCAFLIPPMVQE